MINTSTYKRNHGNSCKKAGNNKQDQVRLTQVEAVMVNGLEMKDFPLFRLMRTSIDLQNTRLIRVVSSDECTRLTSCSSQPRPSDRLAALSSCLEEDRFNLLLQTVSSALMPQSKIPNQSRRAGTHAKRVHADLQVEVSSVLVKMHPSLQDLG